MGRKKKETPETTDTVTTYDRIGEPVNLEKCPGCTDHPDCFACIEGKCTALKENGGQGCVFYKPEQQVIKEAQKTYAVLKKNKRFDLINKYLKALTAMGATDQEFDDGEDIMAELEKFAADDFAAQSAQTAQTTQRENEGGEEGDC